jgi:MtfA peptidase
MAGYIIATIFLLFLLTMIYMVLYQTYATIREIFNYFFKDYVNRYFLFRKLNPHSKAYLQQNFSFYKSLSDKEKKMFERRVQKFMDMKDFVPRGGLIEVTIEMKTLIAASAIQITFGLPSIYFLHFYKILVYPDDYYSTITKRYHRGEVNTRGYLVLSWSHLVHGYVLGNDGRNLGLHEMAHALKIVDAITSEEYNFFERSTYHGFIAHSRVEMQRIANGEESFFRSYAASNDHEFFAVAVENFFERPGEFYDYHSPMYELLCELLRQNPMERKNS